MLFDLRTAADPLDDLRLAIVRRLESLASAAADSADAPEGEEGLSACIEARQLLSQIAASHEGRFDMVLAANAARSAAERLGSAIGETYSADLLDRLFSRFCVGK